jgi:hypothetical protein
VGVFSFYGSGSFPPSVRNEPLEIHKVYLRVYSLLKEKIQAAKLQGTSKVKIFSPRQEKTLW